MALYLVHRSFSKKFSIQLANIFKSRGYKNDLVTVLHQKNRLIISFWSKTKKDHNNLKALFSKQTFRPCQDIAKLANFSKTFK